MAGRSRRTQPRESKVKPNRHVCVGCGQAAETDHPKCLQRTAQVMYDQELRRQLTEFAVPIEVTPEQALLSLVREAAGNVAWLGARIQQLVEDSPVRGEGSDLVLHITPSRTTGLGIAGGYDQGDKLFGPKIDVDRLGTEHIVGEEYRGMVSLYNEERDRLKNYAKDAIGAGILKSQVDLAQYQAQQLVLILNRVLDKMEISEDRISLGRRLLAEEFRVQAQEPLPK